MAKDHAYEQVLCVYVVYRLVAIMIAVVVANRVCPGITCVEVHGDSGLRIYKANYLSDGRAHGWGGVRRYARRFRDAGSVGRMRE